MTDFDAAFDSDYKYFYDQIFPAAQSQSEAELIWNLASLQPGSKVLDAGCGYGRITKRLSRLGANMTGMDQSATFIELAKQDSSVDNLPIDYVKGDTRELPWSSTFDCVLSWSDSLGYFDDKATESILGQFFKALKPGGKLVLQVLSRDRMPSAPRYWVSQRDDDLLVDETRFNMLDSKVVFHRTIVRGGAVRKFDISLRVWTPKELRGLLNGVGFETQSVFGPTGNPPTTKDVFIGVVADRA